MNRQAAVIEVSAEAPAEASASVRCESGPTRRAAQTLLGQNFETAPTSVAAMLSERLENPKFHGPANPQTGIAPGWQPYGNHMGGVRCEVTAGMGFSGDEAQLIHCYHQAAAKGILQPGRWVRQGERLQVQLWAKAWHQPVKVRLGLSPLISREEWYDMAQVVVDASYWKPYHATLTVPRDDDNAVFWCLVEGEGLLWIDQIHLRGEGEGHLRREMIEQLASLRMPTLRFPGGCLSTNYHWQRGIGPVERRGVYADPVFKAYASYEFGTDEYLGLCADLGIQPHITVNIGSGTPDEAAGWAAYCAQFYRRRGLPLPTIYFQMGNEHYGVWENAHMTGPMYVQALREFVPAVRSAYPAARIVALGEEMSGGLRPEQATPWRAVVLRDAGDLFDVLALNRYKGQWFEQPRERMVNVAQSVEKISRDLRDMLRDLRAANLPDKTLGLTEWNYWLYACHWDGKDFYEPGDAEHALFVAGMLNELARLAPAMELASFYHLVNGMGLFINRGPRIETASSAEIFRLYRPAFPGDVLPLTVRSPALGEEEEWGLNAIDALAMRSAEARWLFLANRSPERSITVELADWPGDSEDGVMLQAETPSAWLHRTDAGTRDGNIELPPLSVVRLRYE